MQLKRGQMGLFAALDQVGLRRSLAAYFQEHASDYWHMSPLALEAFADVCIRTSAKYGIANAEYIGAFSWAMVSASPRFHEHHKMQEILHSSRSEDDKIEMLFANERADDWREIAVTAALDIDHDIAFWDENFDPSLCDEIEAKESV